MRNVRLGSTGIIVNKTGFGGLPIQRISDEAAEKLLPLPCGDVADPYGGSPERYLQTALQLRDALLGILEDAE